MARESIDTSGLELPVGVGKRAEIEALAAEIASLGRIAYTDLRVTWLRLYRVEPPKKVGRDVLELGIAWKRQDRVLGGHSSAVRRQLEGLARAMAAKQDIAPPRAVSLKPGARLLRTWDGQTHEVMVVEGGFIWRGKTWRSLSSIAREMTGTRWSGPRFFGLAKRARTTEALPGEASDA